jgi:hypothetical protein
MNSIIKRTNQMEKQCQIWHRDTMRFERFNQENDTTLVPGSQETI